MNQMKRDEFWKKFLTACIIVLVLCGLSIALSGCKTVKTVVEYRELQVHDTIMQVDSVWQDRVHVEYMKGDTVVLRDSVYKYVYKTLDKVVDVTKVDSVPYPVEVEVLVRYVPGYYHFTSWAFWIAIVILIMFIFGWVVKRRYFNR